MLADKIQNQGSFEMTKEKWQVTELILKIIDKNCYFCVFFLTVEVLPW